MHDCATDILAFHNEQVTLLQPHRTAMRDRRNANRDRLIIRLKMNNKPVPKEFIKQGSYAMLTMVQDPDDDYDIDDGIYYTQASLQDKNGNDMPPQKIRQMVSDALQDNRFNKQPQVRKNCVRIFYQEGYHVDMPIYRIRISDGQFELACGDEWTLSRAADVEDWFYATNKSKSPDEINGRQFRRIVRLLKKFARSRAAWKDRIASGFTITKLAEECYVADKYREDVALRNTMRNILNRLFISLEVSHPVTPGAMLTSGANDEGTKFLREKLDAALDDLTILDRSNCTCKEALAAWDKVFDTDFFWLREKDGDEKRASVANTDILNHLVTTRMNPRAVDKRGGGRFA